MTLLFRKVSSKCPLMYSYYETQYLGAAHGLTGVLLQLLSVPHYLEHNPGAEKDIKAAVNFIVSHQTYDGNFISSMGEVRAVIILDVRDVIYVF